MIELVPENSFYKVDASGRVIIPRHLRAKFGIEIGDMMDYYTAKVDGKYFLCMTLHKDDGDYEEIQLDQVKFNKN